MTSRERVLAAFAHDEPDRVPRWCGASDEFRADARRQLHLDDEGLSRRFGDDFRRVLPRYRLPERPLSEAATSRTVFGVEHGGVGYGQPLTHPLAGATLRQVHAYDWPDPAQVEVSHVRDQIARWDGRYAILGGDWSPFWHDAIDLLGMEALMLNMHDEPALVDALFEHLVSFYVESSRRMFDEAADGIDLFFIGNDFGSTTGPLLSPALFERFVLPHLRTLIDLGHQYDLLVQLHCCGGYEPLIGMMIDAGLDGLHAVQPCCGGMDLAHLKKTYGRRIVFNGAIDSQHVLIEGPDPSFVREQTRHVLSIMAPGGGYVAGASHDSILPETPLDNVLAMFDAVEEFGVYPIAC